MKQRSHKPIPCSWIYQTSRPEPNSRQTLEIWLHLFQTQSNVWTIRHHCSRIIFLTISVKTHSNSNCSSNSNFSSTIYCSSNRNFARLNYIRLRSIWHFERQVNYRYFINSLYLILSGSPAAESISHEPTKLALKFLPRKPYTRKRLQPSPFWIQSESSYYSAPKSTRKGFASCWHGYWFRSKKAT